MTTPDERVLDYPIPAPGPLEPPAEWARLRAGCPVSRAKLPSGDEVALLTRYADVKGVLADPRFGRSLDDPDAARISDTESGGLFNSEMSTALPQSGEGHQRWRRLVNRWFTAKRMLALRPEIERMAESLVDDMIAGGGPADLKAALGFPLPVWVICDMLGVPTADRDRFSRWSDTFLNLTRYSEQEFKTAEADFFGYMAGHIAAKQRQPGDDLLSELIAATDSEGERMPDRMLAATGLGLLIAGHETTANMIGKMVAMLLSDRRRWERLLADPSLVRSAVEEVLRFDANSGLGMVRFLHEDVEIAGTELPRGTTVMCNMAAANRDETAFDGADDMDLARTPNPHLAFGTGAHSCLGQALARNELQVTLEVLLRKLPSLELAVPAERLRPLEGLVVGGLSEVPVRW
ncbi:MULTISPECIES: cytochrome P450 [Saccharopolyspora]|uniref:Cytochrome P450 n=1 Tax=Saccharopolyspora gregorii TaxID=33914 RepID=A0ABP6RNN7_9PSEU|nr:MULTISPECIES: cytochrome P450 [Saccharopolyspora]MCA1188525.1 cytochrome P450 [Saccharopolyspora sp. 6T]MCA1196184.1 cytochrome P450 [Saccharopolyspora sp. 6V]MCA1228942.1 cytochrome P450 [Saccharopolyspora sp. 6M]MCA1278306.1 cytochrome P450 [Saccharopolyspora sp. 7B]